MDTAKSNREQGSVKMGDLPQYGRIEDARRLFGLTRGTIYNLLRTERIRGCSLFVKGKKSRIRLIDLGSVRTLIENEIRLQNPSSDRSKGESHSSPAPLGSAVQEVLG